MSCDTCKYHNEFSNRINRLMKNQKNIIMMLVINTFFTLVLLVVSLIAFYNITYHNHNDPIHYQDKKSIDNPYRR